MNSSKENETLVTALVCHGLKSVAGFVVSDSLVASALASIVLSGTACVLALFGNLLTLFAIWKLSLFSNHSYVIIACLAVTDFLSSVTVLPLNIVIRFHDIVNIHNCALKRFFSAAATLLIGWSLIATCIINFDRFFAVRFPLRQRALDLTSFYLKLIMSTWGLWFLYVLVGVLDVLPLRPFLSIQLFVIVFGLLFIIACQLLVFRLVKCRKTMVSGLAPERRVTRVVDALNQRKLVKCYVTVLVFTLAFMVCYLPRFAVSLAISRVGPSFTLSYYGSRWSELVLFWNSAINPIIYAVHLPRIRAFIFTTLRRAPRSRTVEIALPTQAKLWWRFKDPIVHREERETAFGRGCAALQSGCQPVQSQCSQQQAPSLQLQVSALTFPELP